MDHGNGWIDGGNKGIVRRNLNEISEDIENKEKAVSSQ